LKKSNKENIMVIIALLGLIFAALQYIAPHESREVKETPVINNTVVVNPVINNNVPVNLPEPPKESTALSHDIGSHDDVITAATISEPTSKNPSKVDSNVEDTMESKSSISYPQMEQPSIMMSEDITDNNKIGGIGERVLGLGYRLTNEYMPNSLKSTCPPKSVLAYCDSRDSCVDCDGNCTPSGRSKIKNGVTSTCSNGKWMRY
jgi:hypothetical protein